MNLACNAIIDRHSCRKFIRDRYIDSAIIERILEAGALAPSGKNTQPWRFKLLREENIANISCLFKMNTWFKSANQAIAVFMDKEAGYDDQKDTMAIGACIQNILLEAECNGVSTCWIGECTNYRHEIKTILHTHDKYMLMAIVALGYRMSDGRARKQKTLSELMI